LQSKSTPSSRPKKIHIFGMTFSLLLLGVSLYVWFNFQHVLDQINVYMYEPPSSIASIVEEAKMTDKGKFVFYAAQPVIDGTRTFNVKCNRTEKNTAILGCYAGNRIYLFDVRDERLDGIHEVTAVHEMLHAVYHRMSQSDRDRINALLEVEAKHMENSKEFAERMAFYARTEPGERYNELHSIIGTEVSPISAELEKYYQRYFDRQTIIGLYRKYKNEFEKLEAKANKIKVQIDSLAKKIETAKDEYVAQIKALERDIAAFNRRADQGDFASQSQFNIERQALISRRDSINRKRETINGWVSQYNNLIKQHNDITIETNELYKSMDSSLAPAPSV